MHVLCQTGSAALTTPRGGRPGRPATAPRPAHRAIRPPGEARPHGTPLASSAPMTGSHELGATELRDAIASGRVGVEEAARDCLDRAAARDPAVRAWSWLDRDAVLQQARALDRAERRGPLHGVPVGVKDVIDTADMPTQHNSPLFRGHRPALDAACVATLREAGALILGKTDTTEFAAAGQRAATHHPRDPRRSPGGSSAGSAAAVADRQVPLALGTQTAGSTIRPASFCGVHALKPTWGVVGREGVKQYAPSLDTVTWFARTVPDLDLLCEVFGIEDDPAPAPPARPRLALCLTPMWERAQPGTVAAMRVAAERLRAAGHVVEEVSLPDGFDALTDAHATIMLGEGRASFLDLVRRHGAAAHDDFRSRAENRTGITRAALAGAYDAAAAARPVFDALARRHDAVIVPSARGEATPHEDGPGDAVFNRLWTLLHVPCVHMPTGDGPGGMPVGVTLVGPRFGDRRLLAVAGTLAGCLAHG